MKPNRIFSSVGLRYRFTQPTYSDTEQERAAKEQAEAQLITAAQSLLETGMEIERVVQLLGLSQEQLKALR